jgi:hypothetical protein
LRGRYWTTQRDLLVGVVVAAEVFVRVVIAHYAFDLGAVLAERRRNS